MQVELSAFERSARFSRWLDRRIPPSHRLTLSQQSIFIFPSLTGFFYAGLIVLLILGAINYQNSLVYGVAFLLGSLFLVTILYTFRNLSGLTVELTDAVTGFVGEDVEFQVRVSRPKGKGREGIQLGWMGAIAQWAEVYDSEACGVRLFVRAERRGWLDPGRLLIETYYPLGLLRAWTWVDLGARALIYPRPLFADRPDEVARRGDDGELIDPQGSDDFSDMRSYRPGDPVRHIVWRSYARSDQLVVKEYASFLDPRLLLDFDRIAGGTEERLSRLTGMALNAERSGREYALVLPGVKIRHGVGDLHRNSVLKALALHGLE
ncbi:MAG TPA: DUF58 domain-containing protein [Pseudomonadales bacterium]